MNTQAPDQRAYNFAPWRSVYPTDSVGKQLVYSLEQPLEPSRQNPVMRAIGQQGPEPGWWIASAWFVLIPVIAALLSVYTGDSTAGSLAWAFGIDAVGFQVFTIIFILYARHVTRRIPDGVKAPGEVSVRSLRRAALVGDDALAPVARPVDDVAIAASPSTGDEETFAVLPPEWRLLRNMKILGVACIVAAIVGGVILGWMDASTSTFPWYAIIIAPPCFFIGLWALLSSIRSSRAVTVTVGADGLRWRKRALPWSEIRGWTVLYLHPLNTGYTHPSAAYSVIGQRTCLAWLTYPPAIESTDPGARLAQVVQERIQARRDGSLPLRDLTPGAVTISYEVGPRLFWLGRWRLLAPFDRYVNGAPLPHLLVALLSLMLSVLVLLGAIFTPAIQQWYFGGQLAQLEASKAAIHDPLTANTLQWETAPVYGNHKTFTFTSQGYVYPAEDCCGASSLAARPVKDGLVEVTIRQQATKYTSEAGLIFRANAHEKTALAVTVTTDGSWWLYRLSAGINGPLSEEDYLRSDGWGTIQPIHKGHDATNRIAVMMQGPSYTFFINGQCVGRYWSWGSGLAQSGQVGVYVDRANGPVTFSDLLIAPA